MRTCAIVAMSLTLISPAAAQPGDRLVGLLALRQLDGPLCKEPAPGEIALHTTPESADPIGWIRADRHPASDSECYRVILNVHWSADGRVQELPTQEYEEEQPVAAIVLEQRDRWFKVRVPDGAAWLHGSDRDEYFSLQELLVRRPAHLTEAWDGTLARVPGGPGRRPPADPRRRVIGYVTPALKSRMLIQAFERPDLRAPVAAEIPTNKGAGPFLRGMLGRNPAQLPVFQRRRGWLQVGLAEDNWRDDVRVWIQDAPFWRFHGFGSDAEREAFEDDVFSREHSLVQLLDWRYVRGALWLHIEVMSHTIYESAEPPRVVATGWVRAHDLAGKAVVWAHSRD